VVLKNRVSSPRKSGMIGGAAVGKSARRQLLAPIPLPKSRETMTILAVASISLQLRACEYVAGNIVDFSPAVQLTPFIRTCSPRWASFVRLAPNHDCNP
jgi:hypothetical protein